MYCAGSALAEWRLLWPSSWFDPGAKIAARGSSTVPVAQRMQESAAAICCTALPRQMSSPAPNLALVLSACVGLHQHELLAVASRGGIRKPLWLTALSALLQVLAAKGAQHEARGEMLLSFMTGKPSALAAQAASTAAGESLVGPLSGVRLHAWPRQLARVNPGCLPAAARCS